MRPFADVVYRGVAPRGAKLLASRPTKYDDRPLYDLATDRVYLMLHGDYADGRRFRGEDNGDYPVAMDVTNVPNQSGAVAFAGCCWGALPVDQPAGRLSANEKVVAHKGADGSIALTFLLRGATAFVGCTGAHYSPDVRPSVNALATPNASASTPATIAPTANPASRQNRAQTAPGHVLVGEPAGPGATGAVQRTASPAVYEIRGDEGYVRARITESNGYVAWTQPVMVPAR